MTQQLIRGNPVVSTDEQEARRLMTLEMFRQAQNADSAEVAHLHEKIVLTHIDVARAIARKYSHGAVSSQADRAALLSALASVDCVTVFESETPIPLLRLLQPEIYAKGGDYTAEMLAESQVVEEYGGEVRILDYVPSQSTTQIVDRIMNSQPSPSTSKAV